MRKLLLLVIPAAMLVTSIPAAERRQVFPAGAKPVGPYSPGIIAGDFLYASGQGARGPDGKFADTNEAKIKQCFDNVRSIIEAGGLTMEHVVYMQVYLHKSISYEEMGKVWAQVFPNNPPARATLGVHLMPTDTPIEINAVAVRDLAMKRTVSPPGFAATSISPGVLAGGRLYLSGLVGWEPRTRRVPQDPAEQVELALNRIGEVLQAAGMGFENLVFVNPYLTDKVPMNVMNKAYARRFEFGNTPARATIRVSFLPHDTNIEFTGVAVRDLAQRRAVRPKNMAPSPTASPCVWGGDTLYCSAKAGFIPGPNGGIWAESVENQVRQTMRNLLDGLEEGGLDFSHVVASNVYLDNLDEFTKMNGVYGKFFPPAMPPTRTTVAPLPPVTRGAAPNGYYPKLEEISLVAVR
jgi:enamine deaminase RidA (YjgF/YER057c/UK114 family)